MRHKGLVRAPALQLSFLAFSGQRRPHEPTASYRCSDGETIFIWLSPVMLQLSRACYGVDGGTKEHRQALPCALEHMGAGYTLGPPAQCSSSSLSPIAAGRGWFSPARYKAYTGGPVCTHRKKPPGQGTWPRANSPRQDTPSII